MKNKKQPEGKSPPPQVKGQEPVYAPAERKIYRTSLGFKVNQEEDLEKWNPLRKRYE